MPDYEDSTRPTWDKYFQNILNVIKTRSTCLRFHHAAIAVRDKRILASGYNAAPSGAQHCTNICAREEIKCKPGERYELCNSLHAEMNVFLQAAKEGISLKGTTLYITGVPCWICARMIVNSGVYGIKIVPGNRYPEGPLVYLQNNGVKVGFIGGGTLI